MSLHLYASDAQVNWELLSPIQHRYVFVVDLRLSAKRFQLDKVEQASVKLIKD